MTHADGVRLIWSPDPPPGVTCPLSQDKEAIAVVRGPPLVNKPGLWDPPGS